MSFLSNITRSPHRITGIVGVLLIASVMAYYSPPSKSTRRVATQRAEVPKADIPPRTKALIIPEMRSPASEPESDTFPELSISKKTLGSFQVTNLATSLPAQKRLDLAALSESGLVVGTMLDPPPPRLPNGRPARRPAPAAHVARYERGAWKLFPIPPQAEQVIASDVNDRGDVVGVSIRFRRGKPSYTRLIVYPFGSSLPLDLGTLNTQYADADTKDFGRMRGVAESGATINNQGVVAAMVGDTTWIRYPNGRTEGLNEAILTCVNDDNAAVGFGRGVGGTPLFWRDITAVGTIPPVSLVPLRSNVDGQKEPVLRGIPQCVNKRGQAVLAVIPEVGGNLRRQGVTAYYSIRDRKLRLIGYFIGFQRSRCRMNDAGDVVGFSDTRNSQYIGRPQLYRQGELYDLTDVAAKQGWQIIAAIDINNRGQILVYGMRRNDPKYQPVPLLLSPETKPGTKTATVPHSN